jgi:hypothetical protein
MNNERLRVFTVIVDKSKPVKMVNIIVEKLLIRFSKTQLNLLKILHYMNALEPARNTKFMNYGNRVLRTMKATPKLIMLVQFLAMLTIASAICGLHHHNYP